MKINSIFQACEGEGSEVGILKTFIRTQGCNVGCKYCDTPEARVIVAETINMDPEEIVHKVQEFKWKNVTITGGEPLIWIDLYKLVQLLNSKKYIITLETSGQFFNKDVFLLCNLLSVDAKPPSSGVKVDYTVQNKILTEFPKNAQIKVVVRDLQDFEFVIDYYNRFKDKLQPFQLIITPCWEVNQESFNSELVRDILRRLYVLKIPIRVIVQQHKVIYGPRRAGV